MQRTKKRTNLNQTTRHAAGEGEKVMIIITIFIIVREKSKKGEKRSSGHHSSRSIHTHTHTYLPSLAALVHALPLVATAVGTLGPAGDPTERPVLGPESGHLLDVRQRRLALQPERLLGTLRHLRDPGLPPEPLEPEVHVRLPLGLEEAGVVSPDGVDLGRLLKREWSELIENRLDRLFVVAHHTAQRRVVGLESGLL